MSTVTKDNSNNTNEDDSNEQSKKGKPATKKGSKTKKVTDDNDDSQSSLNRRRSSRLKVLVEKKEAFNSDLTNNSTLEDAAETSSKSSTTKLAKTTTAKTVPSIVKRSSRVKLPTYKVRSMYTEVDKPNESSVKSTIKTPKKSTTTIKSSIKSTIKAPKKSTTTIKSLKKSTKMQRPLKEKKITKVRKAGKKYVKKLTKKSAQKANDDDDDDAKEFRCSACGQVFHRRAIARRHVLIVHYGLARINDDTNSEFSDREILIGFKAAIALLKTLKCSICDKTFISALGLKFHREICGKDEEALKRNCELCGRVLKYTSMKTHMDMHKRKEQQSEHDKIRIVNELDSTLEKYLSERNLSKRPIRRSAKKANEFLKSSIEAGEDSDPDCGKQRRRKASQDDDVYFDDNSSEDDSQSSSCSSSLPDFRSFKNSLSIFNLDISTEKSFVLFKLWRDQIELPTKLIEEVRECKHDETGFICKLCSQVFVNSELLAFHYTKCDSKLDSDWSCKLCDFRTESNLITLLKHLIDKHLSEVEDIPTQLIESMIPKFEKREDQFNIPWFLNDTEKFCNQHFSESVFEEWKFDEKLIGFLTKNELQHYLPERRCSPKFKFKTCRDESKKKNQNTDENNQQQTTIDNDWTTLNLFESLASKHHSTFYTGGPVYSGAWCTYPNKTNLDQIVCLSTNTKNRIYNVFDCSSYPGCLQFWNFGPLKVKSVSEESEAGTFKTPKLEFIIAHNYGTISEMVWCPGNIRLNRLVLII